MARARTADTRPRIDEALVRRLNAYTSYAAVNPRVAEQTPRQTTQALIG